MTSNKSILSSHTPQSAASILITLFLAIGLILGSHSITSCQSIGTETHASHEEGHEGHDHSHHHHEEDEDEHDEDEHDHDHAHASHDNSSPSHANDIHFSPEQAEAIGLQTEEVAHRPFASVIRTSGRLVACPAESRTISAPVGGIVTLQHAAATEGADVKSGSTVAIISARGMQDGDPVLKAHAAFQTAKAELERTERLAKDKIVSQSELDKVRLEYEKARVEHEAICNESRVGGVAVKSPVTGYIQRLCVSSGQYVGVGTPLAVVADNSHLQLLADVGERYRDLLPSISSANIRMAGSDTTLSLSAMGGHLASYGRNADGGAYIPVTFEFSNTHGLVPGAFAEVFLLGKVQTDVVSLPSEALVEEQGIYYAFVQCDADIFERREVSIGQNDGQRVQITKGLALGERVVTHGARQLRLAQAQKSIPAHSHNH